MKHQNKLEWSSKIQQVSTIFVMEGSIVGCSTWVGSTKLAKKLYWGKRSSLFSAELTKKKVLLFLHLFD